MPSSSVSIAQPDSVMIHDPIHHVHDKVLVVGAGPVGVKFCHEYLKRQPNGQVTLFSNEPHAPYNRVQLSSLLAGEVSFENIITALPAQASHPNFQQITATIRKIDAEKNTLFDNLGNQYHYDKLVIATGSRPHVPNIPGVDQTGVYTFRNLHDTEALYSRVSRSRHIVVVGGGLLGLEAARALLKYNTQITLVQQSQRLMNRQLDDHASDILKQKIEQLGVNVITQSGVRKIHGSGRVSGVTLYNEQTIACDTVLLCAGIKTNDRIAREAGLKVSKGIVVNNKLATSVENIFAIGECCEHDGLTYGLVSPGFEQAAILAESMTTGKSNYLGSISVSRLKVVGESVYSMGQVAELPQRPHQRVVSYQRGDSYRKIVLYKNKIIGTIAIGAWSETSRIQEAFKTGRRVWPWQWLKFKYTGSLWSDNLSDDPTQWPKTASVCQCNTIQQGTIIEVINNGHITLEALQRETGAGTVCGSCKPLLNQMLGSHQKPSPEKDAPIAAITGAVALLISVLIVSIPGFNVSESFKGVGWFESIWNDKYWKQVTGFTLLGLTAVGLAMSLRKRIKKINFGNFSHWRSAHLILGVFCAATLILHTGFHLGENLNRLLIINFLATLLLGSIAAAVISVSHRLKPLAAKKTRKLWSWLHLLITWPLPMLLTFHIISVYYF